MMLENQDFKNDLQQRLFDFAVQVIYLIRKFPKRNEYEVINYQFIKAATSSGANYVEARAAVSKADFANKIGISLKEMHESNYWIKSVIAITRESQKWNALKQESVELKNILGSK